MPKIQQYTAETSSGGLPPNQQVQASDLAGNGLSNLAQAGGQFYQAYQQKQDIDDVSNVRVEMMKARAEWETHFKERATQAEAGDPTFAPSFKEDLGKYLSDARQIAQTPAGQRTFDQLAADLGTHFSEKADVFQAQSYGVKAKQDFNKLSNEAGNAILSDPTSYDKVKKQLLDAINDPNGAYSRVDAKTRGEISNIATESLARNFITGLIVNGSPELARSKMMDKNDPINEELDAKDKAQLIAYSDVAIRAKDTAADRQYLLDKRIKQDASEASFDKYLQGIISPSDNKVDVSDRAIMSDPTLTPEKKQHLIDYKLRRAHELANNQENKRNPTVVRSLLNDMFANTDPDNIEKLSIQPVRDAYRAGKISTSEEAYLESRFKQLKDGGTNSFAVDFNKHINRISNILQREVVFIGQPDLLSDTINRIEDDANKAVNEARKNGINPRTMLDMDSKDYLFSSSKWRSYLPNARQQVEKEAAKIKEQATLPTYQDFDKLEKGASFTDPQGNVRRKP